MSRVAHDILAKYPNEHVFGFYGEMGAGKTTLIKELCKCLGVKNVTSSPTFAIVNEYLTENGKYLYHFDFYRINDLKEALQIGLEDYLYGGHYCFIEWTEKVEELLQDEFVKITIETLSDNTRRFSY
ncbi:MAG: tRNA (adenosine(37)-N6)-threonylcarbamoyltransferase complex ATPase subunit type 1 TsaE [Bacteroidales bacterium]